MNAINLDRPAANRLRKTAACAAAVASACCVMHAARGQQYPDRVVRIVTAEAGGGGDFVARVVAQGLTESLGQPVIVENRAGVQSIEAVSRAQADGYTLLLHGSSIWLTPFLRESARWDPLMDFAPITIPSSSPNILVVHPALPVKSVRELIAFARAKPGALNFGALVGGSAHLAAELFKAMAEIQITNIPYKGNGPALTAVMGGEVQMMFPNEPERFPEYLDMEDLPLADLARWQEGLVRFLRRVTLARPGRLILKSPTHLGRVRVLSETFSGARFIHIVRDPHAVFPSTMNLWKSHYAVQSLQKPNFAGFEDYVFRCFERMYRAFEAQRSVLDPDQLHELRYEDLVRDPVGQIREIYGRFELGRFDAVLPAIERYLTANKDYQTNRYELDPELRDQIDRRWGPFMRRYGYCRQSPATAASH